MNFDIVLAFAGSVGLAGFLGLAFFMRDIPERYLATLNSMAGGAGLAYVFLYLLFELATEGAPAIHQLVPIGPAPLETLFVFLLVAISGTYVVQSHFERTPSSTDDHRGFALLYLTYNILVGAGLLEEATWGTLNLAFYVAAIGLHLLFNELFLFHRYPKEHTIGWQISLGTAPVLGCVVAIVLGVPAGFLYLSLSLVAGGTITNVLRHELPAMQYFRPIAFTLGVAVYAALILATWRF